MARALRADLADALAGIGRGTRVLLYPGISLAALAVVLGVGCSCSG